MSLHYPVKEKKTKSHFFTLMLYFTSRDFNQSLLDFFNLTDLQFILLLICEFLNLIISGLHCWAVKLRAIDKRSKFAPMQFDCVARIMCPCAVLLKTITATCLIADADLLR